MSRSFSSIGICFVLADYADKVVGKLEVHTGHVVFRHVAGDAIVFAYGAGFATMIIS